jgi:sarcosine oxidase
VSAKKTFDAAVIGAGVFGAWTALSLSRAGARVALLDAHGPANSRASSGGESRVIRAGYGAQEIYTRWAVRSLRLWREFFDASGCPELFSQTGVLWLAGERDALVADTHATLQRLGVQVEKLRRAELERRYPQFDFGAVTWGLYEPEAGALLARRAVRRVVEETVKSGGEYLRASAAAPAGAGRVEELSMSDGSRLSAGAYVYACGPWLPAVFPGLLGGRVHATRQEVFFFGTPPGDARFAPPLMPVWVDFGAEVYGVPDLEGRGFKMALDRHGPAFDPELDSRLPSEGTLAEVRGLLAARFPSMRDAPLVEARVCQYENTSSGDFLIDRHPDFENVWLAGGGSGHGFKHGPAVGEYVAGLLAGAGYGEARFSLATKEKFRQRAIY